MKRFIISVTIPIVLFFIGMRLTTIIYDTCGFIPVMLQLIYIGTMVGMKKNK